MVGIRQTEHTDSLIQSFSGARSALEEAFQYYKVGRHREAFPEKPYFLLSRCTHVLFSWWLAEQESERSFFRVASPPTAFTLGLDFGELRYSEYKRRMLHGDLLEEHLTNETKWFEFWMRILQEFDGLNAPVYQEFGQRLLAWVREPGFLEGKAGSENRKAFHIFMMGDKAGRVMVRTMHVLEDFLRAIVGCFTTPEASTCILEQILLLTGLLSEMRRIIIWETPAKGPYTLSGNARWRTQSPWKRLFGGRTRGLLTVVPRREGGEIVCTFHPVPDSECGRASWMRAMTSLEGTYEAELFATWSYGSGEHQERACQLPDLKACWTVQNAEAGRLEALSRQIDGLLDVLQRDPICGHLVAAVRRLSRNDTPQWTATALPWTYVRQLDQFLEKLTFVYREAKAVGGDDGAQTVIERIWPSGKATSPGSDLSNWRNSQEKKASHGLPAVPMMGPARRSPTPVVSGTLASLLQRLGGGRGEDAKNAVSEPQGSSALPEGGTKVKDPEPVSQESLGEARAVCGDPRDDALDPGEPATRQPDQGAESGSGVSEAAVDLEQPDSAEAAGSAESVAMDPAGAAVPTARKLPQQRPAPAKRTANMDRPDGTDQALLQRLLEHHEGLGRTINYEPLSSTDLQHDLGWSQSRVQRAMTSVFGPKPVSAYRRKCKDRTISTFLKAQAGGARTPRVPIQARPHGAGTVAGTSAKANPRRKNRRRLPARR